MYKYMQNLEKIQLEFEIIIQFCALYLNLCVDHYITIHLSFNMCLFKFFNFCFKWIDESKLLRI